MAVYVIDQGTHSEDGSVCDRPGDTLRRWQYVIDQGTHSEDGSVCDRPLIDQGTHSEDGSRRTYVDVCRLSLLSSERSTDTLRRGRGNAS